MVSCRCAMQWSTAVRGMRTARKAADDRLRQFERSFNISQFAIPLFFSRITVSTLDSRFYGILQMRAPSSASTSAS